ncbi:MAG: virulence protein [Eubacteriales bacterium]
MQINYNVTGSDRKKLATAVAEIIGAEVKYLGTPLFFAYKVGNYHIDKNGILTGEDNFALVADLQELYNFIAVSKEYNTSLPITESGTDNIQILTEAAFDGRSNLLIENDTISANGTPEPSVMEYSDRLTIEMPKSYFSETAFENLKKLVDNKSSLIKKALGIEKLDIDVLDDTIRFPWFNERIDSDADKAYIHFITALCEMAKTKKRINTIERSVDNEKFAFRCFLIQLGFIGDEYKNERKILLSKLSGNSAYAKLK